MLQPGRTYNPSDYRFGFQGQEKDDEITGVTGSHLNYKYRIHDARIGRFFAVDPLTAKYPWNSPYAFSENRVIDCIELEGLEAYSIKINTGLSHGVLDIGLGILGVEWHPFGFDSYNAAIDITYDSDIKEISIGVEVDMTETKPDSWGAGFGGAGGAERETKKSTASAWFGYNIASNEFIADATSDSEDEFKKEEEGSVGIYTGTEREGEPYKASFGIKDASVELFLIGAQGGVNFEITESTKTLRPVSAGSNSSNADNILRSALIGGVKQQK